jgi:exodeoxyribonuclease VII large subunit
MRELNYTKEGIEFTEPSEWRVYTVTELTREIRMTLEGEFPAKWVEGEISNLKRHTSGHLYFSLKDAEAQIPCVMWRGRNQNLIFQPQDGMKIKAFGNLTVFERQGRYQLDVIQIRHVGIGELQLAFEALKRQLEQEGLFKLEYKKPLPLFPERIGIVTSPTGAAIQDIVSIIHRRFPPVQLILRPVRVQGEGAGEDIAEAVKEFNEYGQVDVLIVGRGGGSLEDLWAFNEEIVARSIFHSQIPVISCVGHEIDFSISDFVADLRAPTPSAAAELVVKDREEVIQSVRYSESLMIRAFEERIARNRERIDTIERSYGFRWPSDRLREYRLRIDDVSRSLETFLSYQIDLLKSNVVQLRGKLQSLYPQNVLRRGYSITTRIRDNCVVRRSSEVEKNETVRIRFDEGAVRSVVEEIEDS